MKKHSMQIRVSNKDLIPDYIKLVHTSKQFVKKIERRLAIKKSANHVKFRDSQSIGLRRSLLSAEEANIYTSIPAISMNQASNASVNNPAAIAINSRENTKTSFRGNKGFKIFIENKQIFI